ncbi:Protein jagged-1a [Eumeta japonica]|uniref:Protein jagged-1a n=1 Tax=Eumeta variegata TaxID=151549 RepID=A0A4C1XWT2_EUMVA|nr:Protein jagged-1a [Eumeta japonica]
MRRFNAPRPFLLLHRVPVYVVTKLSRLTLQRQSFVLYTGSSPRPPARPPTPADAMTTPEADDVVCSPEHAAARIEYNLRSALSRQCGERWRRGALWAGPAPRLRPPPTGPHVGVTKTLLRRKNKRTFSYLHCIIKIILIDKSKVNVIASAGKQDDIVHRSYRSRRQRIAGASASGFFELQILEFSSPRQALASRACCGGGRPPPCAAAVCRARFHLCLKVSATRQIAPYEVAYLTRVPGAQEYQSLVTSGGCSFGATASRALGAGSFTLPEQAAAEHALTLPFTFRWTLDNASTAVPDIDPQHFMNKNSII